MSFARHVATLLLAVASIEKVASVWEDWVSIASLDVCSALLFLLKTRSAAHLLFPPLECDEENESSCTIFPERES